MGRSHDAPQVSPGAKAAGPSPRPGPSQGQAPLQEAYGNRAMLALLRAVAAEKRGAAGAGGPPGAPTPAGGTGAPIDPSQRGSLESRFGASFESVRLHTGPEAAGAAASMGARAFTVGDDIAFASGAPRPGTDAGKQLLAHELTHVLQQRAGGSTPRAQASGTATPRHDPSEREAVAAASAVPAGRSFRVREAPGAGVACEGEHDAVVLPGLRRRPLVNYYFLRLALTSDDWSALEEAAARRDALRTGGTPGSSGRPQVTARVRDLLPSDATFEPRDAIVERTYPALADSHGATSAAGTLARALARNEALRAFLSDKLDRQVEIALDDPDGRVAGDTHLTFRIDGVVVTDANGALPVDSLDAIAERRLVEFVNAAAEDAAQLVQIAVADRKGAFAASEIGSLVERVERSRGDYAPNQLVQVVSAAQGFSGEIGRLAGALREPNRSRAGVLGERRAGVEAATTRLQGTLTDLRRWLAPSMPDVTNGELYDSYAEEQLRYAEGNRRAGGWYYAYLPLNYAEYASTRLFQFAGNFLSLGYQDLEARNAAAYRRGDLSNNAYVSNVYWNLGAAAVTGLVMLLTEGLGGRLVSGLFSLEASSLTLASVATRGMGEGMVQGVTTAFAGDVYNSIASTLSSDMSLRQFRASMIQGPGGWMQSGLHGGLFGMGLPMVAYGASSFARWGSGIVLARPRGGGFEIINDPPPPESLILVGDQAGSSPAAPLLLGDGPVTRLGSDPVAPARPAVTAGGGYPYVSPLILEPSGAAFGSGEYLAAGGPVSGPRPTLYTVSGGRVVAVGEPPPTVQLFGPRGEVISGPSLTPEPTILGPSGRPLAGGGAPGGPIVGVVSEPVPESIPPSTQMELWVPRDQAGLPWNENVPGNAMVWGQDPSGARVSRPASSWYEDQIRESYGASKPAPIRLTSPTRFTGESQPQQTVQPDLASAPRDLYGDAKMRDPNYGRFIDNAVGTLERMWMASRVESSTFPAASQSELALVTSRVVPREVHNAIMRRFAESLRAFGIPAAQITEILERVTFAHQRPAMPPRPPLGGTP